MNVASKVRVLWFRLALMNRWLWLVWGMLFGMLLNGWILQSEARQVVTDPSLVVGQLSGELLFLQVDNSTIRKVPVLVNVQSR